MMEGIIWDSKLKKQLTKKVSVAGVLPGIGYIKENTIWLEKYAKLLLKIEGTMEPRQ